jgi:polysaccharide export outer membrane protein
MIGETGSRLIPVTGERMTIIEALASAGDLTMYGRRDNILLIREDNTGKKSVHRLDISDADILNSPYFYLQQNDVIYVEPNQTLINRTAISNNTLWMSLISSVVSLSTLIVALLK